VGGRVANIKLCPGQVSEEEEKERQKFLGPAENRTH
jgi:hypothetical protein